MDSVTQTIVNYMNNGCIDEDLMSANISGLSGKLITAGEKTNVRLGSPSLNTDDIKN
ncbi:MAG: hypothetical protein ACLRK5_06605 [Veillonella nakazawae]